MLRLRRFLIAGFAALFAFAPPAYALTPTEAFYVNDYAGILSPKDAQYLCQRGAQLWEENGVQVVVVIVNNYIGESMESYANKVFNEFGIGSKKDNNGVLLIVAVDDGEVRIEVGDGLSAQIPDSKAGSILELHFMPAASEGDLETAVYRTYLQLIQEGSRLDTKGPPEEAGGLERILWSLAGLALIGLGVLILVGTRHSRRRRFPSLDEPGGRPPAGTPPYTERRAPDRSEPYIPRPLPGGFFFIGRPRREEPKSSGGDGQSSGGGAGRTPFPGRTSQEEPRSSGGGGRSSGGGAGRGFLSGGLGRSGGSSGRSSSGGSNRGFSSGGSGRSGGFGGGGRSSGGGAGRSFKK